MSTELRQALDQVARRFRHERLWGSLALCWLAWALVGLGVRSAQLPVRDVRLPGGWLLVSIVVAVLATAGVCVLWAVRSARDLRWVARRIEAKHPELRTGLLAAVEEVARRSLRPARLLAVRRHPRGPRPPPRPRLGRDRAHLDAAGRATGPRGALIALLAVLATLSSRPVRRRAASGRSLPEELRATCRSIPAIRRSSAARRSWSLPGSMARCRARPGYVLGTQEDASRRTMTRSLEDPTFAGHVESVDSDLSYRVEFEGKSTETFHVHVFEYPELERTDAKLVFPPLHVARAEDRRRYSPRHGRRGDRADVAVPAEQRRRHGPVGRRRGPGDRA